MLCAILYTASILLERISSRGTTCLGDMLSYNCSTQSNSETLQLTWRVTIPGLAPVSITYSNIANNTDVLSTYVTTFLTGFRSDEFIQSTLNFTIQPSIPSDQITIECSLDDLENRTVNLRYITFGENK